MSENGHDAVDKTDNPLSSSAPSAIGEGDVSSGSADSLTSQQHFERLLKKEKAAAAGEAWALVEDEMELEQKAQRKANAIIAQIHHEEAAKKRKLREEAKAARATRLAAEAEELRLALELDREKNGGNAEEGDDDGLFFETTAEPAEEVYPENTVAGRSLFCLDEESGVRNYFNGIVTHPTTENFLLLCILLNSFILAVQTPTNTLGDDVNSQLKLVDDILSGIFSGACFDNVRFLPSIHVACYSVKSLASLTSSCARNCS